MSIQRHEIERIRDEDVICSEKLVWGRDDDKSK
jgi:hypothetical protein